VQGFGKKFESLECFFYF